MPLPVSLQAVVEDLQVLPDGWRLYIHGLTGELVTVSDEDVEHLEAGTPMKNLADWEQDAVRTADEVLHSNEYLVLPSKFDIHEYAIMRDFCFSVPYTELREELLYNIRGSGDFRRFKAAIHHHGMADEWYAYRDAAIEVIAIDWLEENEIPYTRP